MVARRDRQDHHGGRPRRGLGRAPVRRVRLLALAVFVAAVVLDLPLAVGFRSLAFVNQVPSFNQVQDALFAMVALVAIRAFFDVHGAGVTALRRQRWLFVALGALLLWMLLSLAWAVAPERALTDIARGSGPLRSCR